MCGRIIVVDSIEAIEKRFNVEAKGVQLEMNYNLGPGQRAPVITNTNPNQLQMFKFGLTPAWAKKQMYLINARSEGKHNPEDDVNYRGAKGIIEMPSFRKQIRSQRCLIIASAFIEGPKDVGLSKPYLVYLQNHKRPFALAGIWDVWKDEIKGEVINSFSIITTTANPLLQQIGHHRMPVILNQEDELTWLNSNTELTNITRLLNPFDHALMNAYPISPDIKNPRNNAKELIQPLGERLYPEYEYRSGMSTSVKGFGNKNKKSEGLTLGELAEKRNEAESTN